jgi:polyol permease family
MTGDGFEQAFLSHYIVSMGFSQSNASLVFALYGFCAGLSAWSAGVLAEMFGPRKVMCLGAVIWLVFHAMFLQFGLSTQNLELIILFYCFRAIGYPLFVYSFVVWFTRAVAPARLASAMGWFWTMFIFGIGFMGSYVPSLTLPIMGELHTLWLAMAVVGVGAVIGFIALKSSPEANVGSAGNATSKLKQLTRGITLAFEKKSLVLAFVIMMLDPMALFGFAVIMPFLFIDQLGFTSSEWLRIWSMMLLSCMVVNVVAGMAAARIGWLRMIRFQGCLGVAATTLMFYYIPSYFGNNILVATFFAVLHGACLAGFIPLSALFPALAPNEKGAAISLHNLAVGLGSCVGPGLATVILPMGGVLAVVWTYAALYLFAGVLSLFIKIDVTVFNDSDVVESDMSKTMAVPN